MNSLLQGDSCSLGMQRHHQVHGLGCHAARMEPVILEDRRLVLRLAAEIHREKCHRLQATLSTRSKWMWPCFSMLWDEFHAFGLPSETPTSCKSSGPCEEQVVTGRELPGLTPSQADWSGPPPAASPQDWDFWDGGDGGDDGPCDWPYPSPPLVGSRSLPVGVPVSQAAPQAALSCPCSGKSRRSVALCEPAPPPPRVVGFRPSPSGVQVFLQEPHPASPCPLGLDPRPLDLGLPAPSPPGFCGSRPSPPALPEYAVPVSQSPGPRLLLPRPLVWV